MSSSSSDGKTTVYSNTTSTSVPTNQAQSNTGSTSGVSSKAPKIQLKNFANFK
jgi:hypothetical protein